MTKADADEHASLDPPAFDPAAIRPVIAGVLVGMGLAAISQTIVSTALPTIVGELGGYGGLSWVVSAYLLSSAVSVPIAGKLADMFGASLLFRIAIVVFALGSAMAGFSSSMTMLIAARGIQGIGGGAIMTVSFTVIARLVPARERGRYQTKVASVFAVTSIAGPLVGGFFVDQLSWRWAFFVITALCVAALVIVRDLPADGERSGERIDYVGIALIVVVVIGMMLVAVWGGQQYAWTSSIMIGLIVASAIGSVVFVWWERQVDEPIVPVRLLRRRAIGAATALGFFIGLALFGVIVYAPTYLQVSLGASATTSGLLLLPLMGCVLMGSSVGGRVMSRTARYRWVAIAGSATLLVGTALLTTMGPTTPLGLPSLYISVVGIGIGLTMPVTEVAVQNAVEPHQLGVATSISQFTRKIGSTLGVAILGGLFTARVASSLDRASAAIPGEVDLESLLKTPSAINELPAELAAVIRTAVADGANASFTVAFVVAILSLAAALTLPDDELSDVQPGAEDSETSLSA